MKSMYYACILSAEAFSDKIVLNNNKINLKEFMLDIKAIERRIATGVNIDNEQLRCTLCYETLEDTIMSYAKITNLNDVKDILDRKVNLPFIEIGTDHTYNTYYIKEKTGIDCCCQVALAAN